MTSQNTDLSSWDILYISTSVTFPYTFWKCIQLNYVHQKSMWFEDNMRTLITLAGKEAQTVSILYML
jgi:hypothetical protein